MNTERKIREGKKQVLRCAQDDKRGGVGMTRGGRAVKRGMWRCPKCGWEFATQNLWHSCVRVPVAEHFKGKDPLVRKTFDALVRALRRNGPVTMVGSKTRIAFMVRMRFAAVSPQKAALAGHLILTSPARHPLVRTGERFGSTCRCVFRLTSPKQIDAGFRRLLKEAYRVGRQEHLQKKLATEAPSFAKASEGRHR